MIKAGASWLIVKLNDPKANTCSQLALHLPTWRSDMVELNGQDELFLYFIPKQGVTLRIKLGSLQIKLDLLHFFYDPSGYASF